MHSKRNLNREQAFFIPGDGHDSLGAIASTLKAEPGDRLRIDLEKEIDRAGYYPTVVTDVLNDTLLAEQVEAFLVHPETHLDMEHIARHISVLVLTSTRLVVVHVGDQQQPDGPAETVAQASSEAVGLEQVQSVSARYVYTRAHVHQSGSCPHEVIVAIGWGTASRTETGPATCGDPECTGDHGFVGQSVNEDVVLRVSAEADGVAAVRQAQEFVKALRLVSGAAAARPVGSGA